MRLFTICSEAMGPHFGKGNSSSWWWPEAHPMKWRIGIGLQRPAAIEAVGLHFLAKETHQVDGVAGGHEQPLPGREANATYFDFSGT